MTPAIPPTSPPPYLLRRPQIAPSAFVAEGATVVGDVTLGELSSVWYGAVLRGDINRIVIGPRSNIQDGAIVHLADDLETRVGELVTCGHRAILHACTIEDEVLIGMAATVMDGAVVGARSIVGAGALVTGGTVIPPGSLVLGAPAKVVRRLLPDEQATVKTWAEKYVATSRHFIELGYCRNPARQPGAG
ncbi:gamma carbonic anhydrase family protein [soil metagenome]